MKRTALFLVALAGAATSTDAAKAQEFEFKFAGCRDITGAAGSVVSVEVDVILNASEAGVQALVYSLSASSPDGVEFLLKANHRLPCSPPCVEEEVNPDLDVFFARLEIIDPDIEPRVGPLAGAATSTDAAKARTTGSGLPRHHGIESPHRPSVHASGRRLGRSARSSST